MEVFNDQSRMLLVSGPRWSGKCVDGDTIVMTPTGFSRMRDFGPAIKPGDYVLHERELMSFCPSLGVVPAKTSGFYRDPARSGLAFTTHAGYQIKTSVIHPLWCMVDSKEGWKPAHEIADLVQHGHVVCLPLSAGHPNWGGSNYKSVSFLPMDLKKRRAFERNKRIQAAVALHGSGSISKIAQHANTDWITVQRYLKATSYVTKATAQLDEPTAYFLGLIAGDGCTTPANFTKHRIGFSSNDESILTFIRGYLTKYFPKAKFEHVSRCDYQIISCSEVRGLIEYLGLCCYAHEKRIPAEIIESPKTVVRAFLQGLFDTDGTADRFGRVSYCSSSEGLARDVQQLLLGFNCVSHIHFKKNACRGAWLVDLYGHSRIFYAEVGFLLQRKQDRRTLQKPWKQKLWHKPRQCGQFIWKKITSVTPVSVDLYDVSVPQHHSFIGGGFINHNTWAVVHKVCRHLWETPGARVALFSKTVKSAKDGGIWEDLVSYAIPEWIKANLTGATDDITFKYTVEPKIDGQTRTLYFRIQNYWGTESELKLFSLDYDGEVESKVKGTRFSMVWFSELTNFDTRNVLTATKQQLRMPHLQPSQHQWIADTNPSEDGEDNWIYQVWYKERTQQEYPENCKTEEEKVTFREFQKNLGLTEIMIDDNLFLTDEKKREIKADFAYDQDLYDRYVLGKWVSGTTRDRMFADLYKPGIHVRGDASSVHEDDWEVLLPDENCFELYTGWDIGETNHSAHIMEKRIVDGQQFWVVLDELVRVNEQCSIENFTREFMDKMAFIEAAVKHITGNKDRTIYWHHYSDDSINKYRSTIDDYERNLVFRASGGKIDLQGVPKPDGSVMVRAHLLRRLLYENRIRISDNCKATKEMLRRCRKGKSKTEPIMRDKHKHPLDSLTYCLLMESSIDAAMPLQPTTKRKDIISVPLD